MRLYKGYRCCNPNELRTVYPIHVNIWLKILEGFIVLEFAGIIKGEKGLKKSFPEASGIVRFLENSLDRKIISTIVVIFTEDLTEGIVDV